MRRNDIQRRNVQPELARLGEFAHARAEREERIARHGRREVGEAAAHVVHAVLLDAKDVVVCGGAFGVRAGGGGGEEGGEGAAGVVCEFVEERLRLGVCEGPHGG